MKYHVIQWATGFMGKTCLRAVIDHPDLEPAGSVVNAIPEVCAAPAGIFHFPLFAPYRKRFSRA